MSDKLDDIESKAASLFDSVTGMRRTVDRLIDTEAPVLTDDKGNKVSNQVAAIDCVIMFSSGATIRGALSRTPEGTLRMMSPAKEGDRTVLVEQFFGYEAVTAISIVREVKVAPVARRGSIVV